MAEEIKKVTTKVELSEDELDQVAGGAYVDGNPIDYRCGFCGTISRYYSRAEIKNHVVNCPNNPNNK